MKHILLALLIPALLTFRDLELKLDYFKEQPSWPLMVQARRMEHLELLRLVRV